jgi:EF hand domain-containing protein
MTSSRVFVLVAGLALWGSSVDNALAQTKVEIQKMDRDGDGVVTRAEWQGSRAAFNQHDTNGDNVLSGNEVWDGGYRRNRNGSGDNGTFDDWTPQAFTNIDRNRDGRITLSEWRYDRESFNRADRNRDNVLSRAEFLGEDDSTGTGGSGRGTYQAGYERGWTEGTAAGREDFERNQGWDIEGQRELETADSGYEPGLGPKAEYQDGYTDGFHAGYRDGWYRASIARNRR